MLETADELVSKAQDHAEWRYLQARHYLNSGIYENTIDGVSATFHTDSFREFLRAVDYQNEAFLIRAIIEEVETDDVFWDIGANIGTHTCYIGQLVANVVSVEPHPRTASRLAENCDLNNIDATVVESAIGSDKGTIDLHVPNNLDDELGLGTFTTRGVANSSNICTVPQTTGDDLVDNRDLATPTVMKIDVEGAEHDVLTGFDIALESCRVIFVEVHDRFVEPEAITETLTESGYEVETLHDRARENHIVAKR
ncbi:FkbM family methyltransferase [Haloterrigena alkaliphila]|uniref:FkbM family methyltransferase n=1 Tax=Haloterrigena alkaliphila TaxID=2816475 RepID=A0A8A2VGZ5_9EURY|nr:FkbM family methyltransferase [Haloterrigena alkaliphila]QSW99644.1 FkbM family methyltransferase [Haloterrigena alkaliphila]